MEDINVLIYKHETVEQLCVHIEHRNSLSAKNCTVIHYEHNTVNTVNTSHWIAIYPLFEQLGLDLYIVSGDYMYLYEICKLPFTDVHCIL